MVETEVKGLRELMLALEKLPQEIQKKPVQQALRAAAKPMRDTAIANAAVFRKTGTVEKNIKVVRSKVYNGKNFVYGVVLRVLNTSKRRRAKGMGDPFYWKFLEFGTSTAPARPFLRPAFDGNKDRAVQIIKERLAKAIETEARKLNRGPR